MLGGSAKLDCLITESFEILLELRPYVWNLRGGITVPEDESTNRVNEKTQAGKQFVSLFDSILHDRSRLTTKLTC
jgi:hypothetical protein